jgi:hypothetical protein
MISRCISQADGPYHTRMMEQVVARMRMLGRAMDPLLPELVKCPSTGERPAAIAALQVQPDPSLHHTERAAYGLYHPVRLVIELEHHARGGVGEIVEGNDAGIRGAAGVGPGNALVRGLLRNLGIPCFPLAGDARHPMQAAIVQLRHRFHALHEAGKFLEPGSLVICRAHRHVDVDVLLDSCHP